MSDSRPAHCCSRIELVYANLLLRLWVGLRLGMAAVDKWRAGSGDTVSFSMDNYTAKTQRIADLTHNNGFLPQWMCNQFGHAVGYMLGITAIWVTVGLFTRLGLLAAGFVVLSLGFGLATLPDDTEVVLIGIHVLLIAAALATNPHNKISLDGILFRGKGKAASTEAGA